MRFKIKSAEIMVKRGTAKATGQPFEIRSQHVFMENPITEEVIRFEVALGRDQSPYAPGVYTLSPESFVKGDYGDLTLGRVQFLPVSATSARAA